MVNAMAEDELAVIQGFGEQELKVGENLIELIVTAEDDSTSIYTLKITREEEVMEPTTTTKILEKRNDSEKDNIKSYILIGSLIGLIAVIIIIAIIIKKK